MYYITLLRSFYYFRFVNNFLSFIFYVKQILRCFEEWNTRSSFEKVKYSYIDVTLVKNDTMYYTIQITNYGQSINDILSFSREIFWNFITTNTVFKNSVIATVCSQNEYSDSQETLDIYFVSNRLSLVHSKKNVNLINFLYQKTYLSFVIKVCNILQMTPIYFLTLLAYRSVYIIL